MKWETKITEKFDKAGKELEKPFLSGERLIVWRVLLFINIVLIIINLLSAFADAFTSGGKWYFNLLLDSRIPLVLYITLYLITLRQYYDAVDGWRQSLRGWYSFTTKIDESLSLLTSKVKGGEENNEKKRT